MRDMLTKDYAKGLGWGKEATLQFCDACKIVKAKHVPYRKRQGLRSDCVLGIVHADIIVWPHSCARRARSIAQGRAEQKGFVFRQRITPKVLS